MNDQQMNYLGVLRSLIANVRLCAQNLQALQLHSRLNGLCVRVEESVGASVICVDRVMAETAVFERADNIIETAKPCEFDVMDAAISEAISASDDVIDAMLNAQESFEGVLEACEGIQSTLKALKSLAWLEVFSEASAGELLEVLVCELGALQDLRAVRDEEAVKILDGLKLCMSCIGQGDLEAKSLPILQSLDHWLHVNLMKGNNHEYTNDR